MRIGMLALLASLAAASTGCTLTREVYHTARGSEGHVLEVNRPGSLGAYDGIRVENIENPLGAQVSPTVPTLIKDKTQTRVNSETALNLWGDRTMILRGRIVYFHIKGRGKALISPTEEVICHFELFDPDENMLGWAVIAGKTESRMRRTSRTSAEIEMSDGVAKGVVEWLTNNGVIPVAN